MRLHCQTIQEKMIESETSILWLPKEQAHLSECNACQSLWSSHERALKMGQTLQELRTTQNSSSFTTDWMVQRIRSQAAQRKRVAEPQTSKGWYWGGLSIAAGLMIFVMLQTPIAKPIQVIPSPIATQTISSPTATQNIKSARPSKLKLNLLVKQAWTTMFQATTLPQDDLFKTMKQRKLSIERTAMSWNRAMHREEKSAISWLSLAGEISEQALDPEPISQALPQSMLDIQELVKEVIDSNETSIL